MWEFYSVKRKYNSLKNEFDSLWRKGAVHVRAGECQFAAIFYRLRFGCCYFDMLERMCNQPIEIGFHFQ